MSATIQPDSKAAMEFAMRLFKQLPQDDLQTFELHLTSALIVFWGALWGTFGTEYARGFIEAQLRGMEDNAPHETFVAPKVQ